MSESFDVSVNRSKGVNTISSRMSGRVSKRANCSTNKTALKRVKKENNKNKRNSSENRGEKSVTQVMGQMMASGSDNIPNSDEIPVHTNQQNLLSMPNLLVESNNVENSNTNGSQSDNNVINNSQTNDGQVIAEPNQTCIDLTQDESIVDNNVNVEENDPEIQLISHIKNSSDTEVAIIREKKSNRRRRDRMRSRSPNCRNEDIIEIINTQTETVSIDANNQNENRRQSTGRKPIKCPICLEDDNVFASTGRQLVSTNCGHLFCDRCIKEVIKTSKLCPNCRKKVTTNRSFHPIYI